jgi:ABC-type sugar transport system ATPase subunit
LIQLHDLTIRQGAFVLSGLSLTVPAGCYAVLMGKSGCGKTTLLEVIAGLRALETGTVALAGRDVTRMRPADRHVGYVPQDGALFPAMTVRQNLGFALEVRGCASAEIAARVAELAEWLELGHLLDRRPHFLSGGEKQRVALGRALASRPPVLLLDEPLGALDDDTREHLVTVLARLRDARAVTVLHVTHNRAEAARLADSVFRLSDSAITADPG